LEAVASATVVAKNLHMAASLTTGRPASVQGWFKEEQEAVVEEE
jgi:hypothetical protein